MILKELFEDKVRLLESFLERTKNYKMEFSSEENTEKKLDLIDELSDFRESNVNVMRALDQEIQLAKSTLNTETRQKLQTDPGFQLALEKTLQLIKEIQLTDQSLFLYIQSMGSELRAQIIQSLKEKEVMSKFKSQAQTQTGDDLDKTV
jgi:hypothetical protein